MEKAGVQDTLIEMVDRLKKNKYIRWAFPHFLFMPRSRSASVDFWFSSFKESELREEEKSFYEKLGAFLINQPKYIQVGALLQIQLDAPIFIHFIFPTQGCLVEGREFHKYYFDLGINEKAKSTLRVNLIAPRVHLLGENQTIH